MKLVRNILQSFNHLQISVNYSFRFISNSLSNVTLASCTSSCVEELESAGNRNNNGNNFTKLEIMVIEELRNMLGVDNIHFSCSEDIRNDLHIAHCNMQKSDDAKIVESEESKMKQFQHALSVTLEYHEHLFAPLYTMESASSTLELERLSKKGGRDIFCNNSHENNDNRKFKLNRFHDNTNRCVQENCRMSERNILFNLSNKQVKLFTWLQYWVYLTAHAISKECFLAHQSILITALLGPSDLHHRLSSLEFSISLLSLLQLLMRGAKSYLELLVHHDVQPQSKDEWSHFMSVLCIGNTRAMHEIVETVNSLSNTCTLKKSWSTKNKNKELLILLHVPLLNAESFRIRKSKSNEEEKKVNDINIKIRHHVKLNSEEVNTLLREYQSTLRMLCSWRELFALIKWRVDFAPADIGFTHIASTVIRYLESRFTQEQGFAESSLLQQEEHLEKELKTLFNQNQIQRSSIVDAREVMHWLSNKHVTPRIMHIMLQIALANESECAALAKVCEIDKNKNINTSINVQEENKNAIISSLQELEAMLLYGKWCEGLRALLEYVMRHLESSHNVNNKLLHQLERRRKTVEKLIDKFLLLYSNTNRCNYYNQSNENFISQNGKYNAINDTHSLVSCAQTLWMEVFNWIDLAVPSHSRQSKMRKKLLTHQWAARAYMKCKQHAHEQPDNVAKEVVSQIERRTMLTTEEAHATMTCAEREIIIQPPIAALNVLAHKLTKQNKSCESYNKHHTTSRDDCQTNLLLDQHDRLLWVESLAEDEIKSGRSSTVPATFVIDLRRRLLLIKAVAERAPHIPLSLIEFEGIHDRKTRKRLLPFVTHNLRLELRPQITMAFLGSILHLVLVCNESNKINTNDKNFEWNRELELLLSHFERWVSNDVDKEYKLYSSLNEYLSQILVHNGHSLISTLLSQDISKQLTHYKISSMWNCEEQEQQEQLPEQKTPVVESTLYGNIKRRYGDEMEQNKEELVVDDNLEKITETLRAYLVRVAYILLEPKTCSKEKKENSFLYKQWHANCGFTYPYLISRSSEAEDSRSSNDSKIKNQISMEYFWSFFKEGWNGVEENVNIKKSVGDVTGGKLPYSSDSRNNNIPVVHARVIPSKVFNALFTSSSLFDNYLHSLHVETIAQIGNLNTLLDALLTSESNTNIQESSSNNISNTTSRARFPSAAIHVLSPESMQVTLKALILHFLHIISKSKNDHNGWNSSSSSSEYVEAYQVTDDITRWFTHHDALRILFCAIPVHNPRNMKECDAQVRSYLQGMYHSSYIQILYSEDDVIANTNNEIESESGKDVLEVEQEEQQREEEKEEVDNDKCENRLLYKNSVNKNNNSIISLLAGRCYRYITPSPMTVLCKKENLMLKQMMSHIYGETNTEIINHKGSKRVEVVKSEEPEGKQLHNFCNVQSTNVNVAFVCVNVEMALKHFVDQLNSMNISSTSEPVMLANKLSSSKKLPFNMLAMSKPTRMNCTLHATLSSLVLHLLLRKQQKYFDWYVSHRENECSISVNNNAYNIQCNNVTDNNNNNINSNINGYSNDNNHIALPELSSSLPILHEHGLLNRIDVGTSGIVLVCTSWAQLLLARNAALQHKSIYKTYRAIVASSNDHFFNCTRNSRKVRNNIFYLPLRGGIYDAVVHSVAESGNRNIINDNNSSNIDNNIKAEFEVKHTSFTQFRVLRYNPEQQLYEVEVQLRSGKRHQIRQHFRNIGFPLVGDARYNSRWCNLFHVQNNLHNVNKENVQVELEECAEQVKMEKYEKVQINTRESDTSRAVCEHDQISNECCIIDNRLALHAYSVEIRQVPLLTLPCYAPQTNSVKSDCVKEKRNMSTLTDSIAIVTCPLPDDYKRLRKILFTDVC